ncbi:hypothetical protein [Vreelandella alkaliphila]|uniref:Uncharacterized protein n=1 Tax=Vreelandella alkaliphila TaxID=272774 RepID=A0A7C9P3B8_9GAMM|nr:hypothetical protein [Halomonas alkaliphila]NDL70530.1 hypothetical protein [Halomonas alkaliphila]
MTAVTPIHNTPVMTQAHRDAIAHVQDLAISISQQGTYAVFIDYDGNVQWLDARWVHHAKINNGNYQSDASHRIKLPARLPDQGHRALAELQALARELEALLIPPTGDDAA